MLVEAPTGVPAVSVDAPVDERIVAGALQCVARWGLTKTTLDDIAREAGCSRATLYRTFPGGKDTLLAVLISHEVGRFFDQLDHHLRTVEGLDAVVTESMAFALHHLGKHEALGAMLTHDAEIILPQLAQGRLDGLLAVVSSRLGRHLSPPLPVEQVPVAAELILRIVLSLALRPTPNFDLSDPTEIHRLAHTFVLPGIRTLQGDQ